MNRDEALKFLLSHQPLPPDQVLSKATIEKYDEVRRFFLIKPDVVCVPLFLGSFGDGDGLGVYQLIGDVFRKLPLIDVVSGLKKSLTSEQRSVRYWSAQLAAEFPSLELVAPLLSLLKTNDHDIKYAVLTALEQSSDSSLIPGLEVFLSQEDDEELRELTEEIIENLSNEPTE